MKDTIGQAAAADDPRSQTPQEGGENGNSKIPTQAITSNEFQSDKMVGTAEQSKFSWDPLPTELWHLIFDQLNHRDLISPAKIGEIEGIALKKDAAARKESNGKRDFASISLLSRRLHRIVEPFLYNKFSWISHIDVHQPPLVLLENRDLKQITKSRRLKRSRFPWRSGPAPYLFLRALLHHPTLVRHVRSVQILAASPESGLFWNKYDAREGAFTPEEFEICEKTIARLPSISRQVWYDGLQKGRLDVIIGLLFLRLSRSSHLNTIDIRIRMASTVGSPIFEALAIPIKRQKPHLFEGLTSVTFSMDKDESGDPFVPLEDHHDEDDFDVDTQMKKLLRLPKLETLTLHYCSPDPSWPDFLPMTLSLRKLTLKHGSMRERMLGQLLASTPLLEELNCDLVYDRSMGQYLNAENLNKSLSQIEKTLTRLSIRVHVLWPRETEDGAGPWDVQETMGSMKHFKKLTYLDIPQIVLIPKMTTGPDEQRTNPLSKILPDFLTVFKTCRSPGSPDQFTRRQMDKIVMHYVKKNKRLMEGFDLAREQFCGEYRGNFEDHIRESVIYGYTTFWDWAW